MAAVLLLRVAMIWNPTSIQVKCRRFLGKLARKSEKILKPFDFPGHRILPRSLYSGRFPQASARRPLMLTEQSECGFMTWTRAALRPDLGSSGGSAVGPHPPGSAAPKGSRRPRLCAKLPGSSGKADLGQGEPGRGTNDSLSHILQGKSPAVCVAFGAGHRYSLGSRCSQNKSPGPATRAQPRNTVNESPPPSHPAHVPALSVQNPAHRTLRLPVPKVERDFLLKPGGRLHPAKAT